MAKSIQEPGAEVVAALLELTPAVVDRACFASISMRSHDGSVHTRWATADAARRIDERQYQLAAGPCVEAERSGTVFNWSPTAAPRPGPRS